MEYLAVASPLRGGEAATEFDAGWTDWAGAADADATPSLTPRGNSKHSVGNVALASPLTRGKAATEFDAYGHSQNPSRLGVVQLTPKQQTQGETVRRARRQDYRVDHVSEGERIQQTPKSHLEG